MDEFIYDKLEDEKIIFGSTNDSYKYINELGRQWTLKECANKCGQYLYAINPMKIIHTINIKKRTNTINKFSSNKKIKY